MTYEQLEYKKEEIEAYLQDPVMQEFLELMQQRRIDYSDIYRIRKYLEQPQEYNSIFNQKEIAYLTNNLRSLHKLLKKKNACRIFLSLRNSDNCYSLSNRLKISRPAVKWWLELLLESLLIKVRDFDEGNEILFRRNYDRPHIRRIIFLLDFIAENKLKQIALDQTKDILEF